MYNVLWRGYGYGAGSSVGWVNNVWDGSYFGFATYAKGVVNWTLAYPNGFSLTTYPFTYYPADVYATGTAHIP
jgi:hypothetical protein